jgi:hypothetical protein
LPVRSSTVGGDLFDEPDGGALRGPEPQRDVGDLLAHGGRHHGPEVGFEAGRVGDDVDGTEQSRRDRAQLVDDPVGAHAAAVAGELPDAGPKRLLEVGGCLGFVLAVGEQDRVPDRAGRRVPEQRGGAGQPAADGGAAAGLQHGHGLLGQGTPRRRCGCSRIA